jgi:hypothetical protein
MTQVNADGAWMAIGAAMLVGLSAPSGAGGIGRGSHATSRAM